jgi:hypothetical protein
MSLLAPWPYASPVPETPKDVPQTCVSCGRLIHHRVADSGSAWLHDDTALVPCHRP